MEEWQDWQKYLVAFFFGLIASAVILLIARRPTGIPLTLYPPPTPQPYQVHVDGAVNSPGVYTLEGEAVYMTRLRQQVVLPSLPIFGRLI